jgi:hypothetical protein
LTSDRTSSIFMGDFPVRHLVIPLRGGRSFGIVFPRDLTRDDLAVALRMLRFWSPNIAVPAPAAAGEAAVEAARTRAGEGE